MAPQEQTLLALPEAVEPASEPDRSLHVAVVDEELPYPPTSGKRIRTLNLVLRLARRHRLSYLCHRNADPAEAKEAETFFRDNGIETVVVNRATPPRSVLHTGPRFYARLALNLLSPRPYLVDINYSRALRDAVARHAAERRPDLWQCEWTPYAEVVRRLPVARWLVMAHNVESLIWQRYFETEQNPVRRWYIHQQWRKFERYERRTFAEATRTVAVSADDAGLARGRFGAERVRIVENGVDTSYFHKEEGPRDPCQILYLGALDWRPNLDAVRLLLEQVFPAVHAKEPSARLCLVGRNPPPWLVDQASRAKAVELHANVEDVRPFLAGSGVMAVPLRIGGGSRLKILEALASGLPVVSTRIGAEGLGLESGRDLQVVERVEEMAPALLHCIRTPDEARAAAENGRRFVCEQYDWDLLADKLERVWYECLGHRPRPVSRALS
jgi:glycosyltransferase involved in cell wall biosynthesis